MISYKDVLCLRCKRFTNLSSIHQFLKILHYYELTSTNKSISWHTIRITLDFNRIFERQKML